MRRLLQESKLRLVLGPALLLAMCLSGPALAQDDDEEEEEPGAFREYLSTRANNLKGGINGILTFPADPIGLSIDGADYLDDWWRPAGHFAGFFGGIFQGVYRVFMGACDVAFTPIPYMPMLSPVPRYKILSFEHEDE